MCEFDLNHCAVVVSMCLLTLRYRSFTQTGETWYPPENHSRKFGTSSSEKVKKQNAPHSVPRLSVEMWVLVEAQRSTLHNINLLDVVQD